LKILVIYLIRWGTLNKSRYQHILVNLARQGHEIYILQPPAMASTDTGFIQASDEEYPNITTIDVEMNKMLWNAPLPYSKIIKKGSYCLKLNKVIDKYVQKFNIDVVLYYNLLFSRLAGLDSCVTVYDLGDDHIDLLKSELGVLAFKPILKYFDNKLLKILQNSDAVLTVSHYLKEKYPVDSYVIPNGVSLDLVQPGCGKWISDKYKQPIIGFVGSLEFFIDFDLILHTAKEFPEYTFIIAGGGREYDNIVRKINELNLNNVILTGGLKHEEILQYVDSFDICLNIFKKSPLTDGACPIKLFEYMAFKKPIISTRIFEVQKIDDDFLYFASTKDEMAATIRHILSNPDEVVKKTAHEYEILKRQYTWEIISDNFLKTLQEKINNKSR
jgi:glycosyltransferase involved in cell wall biosynthesis